MEGGFWLRGLFYSAYLCLLACWGAVLLSGVLSDGEKRIIKIEDLFLEKVGTPGGLDCEKRKKSGGGVGCVRREGLWVITELSSALDVHHWRINDFCIIDYVE